MNHQRHQCLVEENAKLALSRFLVALMQEDNTEELRAMARVLVAVQGVPVRAAMEAPTEKLATLDCQPVAFLFSALMRFLLIELLIETGLVRKALVSLKLWTSTVGILKEVGLAPWPTGSRSLVSQGSLRP